jgi:type II secretory pathway component PulC
MGGLIAQPDSWRALIEPMDGALVVADDSGFSAMLGLKRGDRIEQANGIALQTPDDVIGAVLRPLASNQPVRLTGSRGGQPHELWLRNAGCS